MGNKKEKIQKTIDSIIKKRFRVFINSLSVPEFIISMFSLPKKSILRKHRNRLIVRNSPC